MAAPEGKITVKLHLDATEFHAELDKVIERLEKLGPVVATEAHGAIDTLKAKLSVGEHVISGEDSRNTHRVL
jgi:hypothetical protein